MKTIATIKYPTSGNLTPAQQEGNVKRLVDLGVPINVARDHGYSQSIVVKEGCGFLYIRGVYLYRCYPGAGGERSSTRTLLRPGTDKPFIADARSGDNRGEWETRGNGSIDLDGEDQDHGWWSGQGAREFDICAHILMRGEAGLAPA